MVGRGFWQQFWYNNKYARGGRRLRPNFSCHFLFWYSCFLAQCGNFYKKNLKNLHPPPPLAPILTVFSPPNMPGVAEGYAQIFPAIFSSGTLFFYLNAAITKKIKQIYTPPPRRHKFWLFSPPNMPGVAEGYAQIFPAIFSSGTLFFSSMRQCYKKSKTSTPPPPRRHQFWLFFRQICQGWPKAMLKFFLPFSLLVLCFLLAQCGYHKKSKKSTPPRRHQFWLFFTAKYARGGRR